jgi:hypothetical protein
MITIVQNGTGVGGNFVVAEQVGYRTEYSQATVKQNGENLNAIVSQRYTLFDVAYVDQKGANSNASITQQVTNGGGGYAYIQQAGYIGFLDATITQVGGSSNNAQIYQANQAGPFNQATISQTESYNVGVIDQSSITTVSTSGMIGQKGDYNKAYLYQRGDGGLTMGSTATITQLGNFNNASLTQYGGTANSATITQMGDQNSLQGYTGSSALQVGTSNSLNITQTSLQGGQSAFVQQLGNSNAGVITQRN